MRNRKATTADFLIAGFLFLLVLAVVVPFIIVKDFICYRNKAAR